MMILSSISNEHEQNIGEGPGKTSLGSEGEPQVLTASLIVDPADEWRRVCLTVFYIGPVDW